MYFVRQLSLLGTEHGSRKFEELMHNYQAQFREKCSQVHAPSAEADTDERMDEHNPV